MYLNAISWLNENYWWPVILFILAVIVIVRLLLLKKSKEETLNYQESEEKLIEYLGGLINIENASIDGNRSKFTLKSVDKVNIEGFKEMNATGIFISGNKLKMSLPFPVEKIIDKINSDISGGKL